MEKEELSLKRNTVSIKVDIDADSDDSFSDSESVGLQIDISEVDNFDNTNRLGQKSIEPPAFLNEMAEELERKLETKAAKSNLTATNVKNIIKQVMTHETVVEMCNRKLINNDSSFTFSFEPKFTRSKAKELAIKLPDIPLPPKNANPEIQALVQEEILEDSSDEEYNPEHDQNKDVDELIDEDKDVEYSEESDFDSQPSTPATPHTSMEMPQTLEVQYDEEGIFKIPQLIPNVPTEEESIGHRTRSKLSLEETPMELIDQMGALVAPDFSLDMCYGDPEIDDYSNFLNELFYAPPPREVNDPDDPINDPEYVAEIDLDIDSLYEDEFKKGRDTEISRKELKTLIADLSDFADQFVDSMNTNNNITTNEGEEQQQLKQQVQKVSKKKKTPDNSFTSQNTVISITILDEPPIPSEMNATSYQFTPAQRQLLSIQMTQHIQLATQLFLMTYEHPILHKKSEILKQFLLDVNDAKSTSEVTNSAFSVDNVDAALELVDNWETKLSDPTFLEEYTKWITVEQETAITLANSKRKYNMKFHYELIKEMCESKALMHPHLLPEKFVHTKQSKKDYLRSEENLIAIGLEEYLPIVSKKPKKFTDENCILADALQLVMKNKTPIRNVRSLLETVKKRRRSKLEGFNPIKHYYTTGSAPAVIHHILAKYEAIPPKEQCSLLSQRWRSYVENLKNGSLKELLSSSYGHSKKFTDDDENLFLSPYSERIPIPPVDHELRNPIVNMMRRMSTFIASQKSDTNSNRTSKTNRCKTRSAQSKANEIESDAETDQNAKADEVEGDKSRPHRLRMTSPRLARIKSVQNMKLLAQNVPSKSSSSTSSVSENYKKNDDDTSSLVKGDNEDEIAALMEASTTIKKSTTNRKKTKQARELENLKKLSEAEKNINKDERATKFASSFIQKVHDTLEPKDPELLKTIIKILIDYSEKLENLNQTSDDYFSNKASSACSSDKVLNVEDACTEKDKLSIGLYKEIYEKLRDYQDLCSDLLLFLTPAQAAMIDLSVEHTMLEKMNHFVNVFQCYFAKQPSRIEKIMQAITQIAMDPYVTQESAQATMGAALKGQPHIMDLFLQTLPSAKPPESLCPDHMFENLVCPVGPHDKNKLSEEDSRELYENIDMPVSTLQEDPYGGDGCKCDCHNWIDDSKSKGINEHCPSCAMKKFLNGRVYLQTSEGLRPAKISFQGGEDEKLENISRVSLKNREERIIPCQPPKKRRKTTKRDSISEDLNPKPGSSKGSPSKSNDDNDKATAKLKKSVKSPPKTIDQKKPAAKSQGVGVKSKREKKNEKKDLKSEQKTDDEQNDFTSMADQIEEALVGNKFGELSTDSHEEDNTTSPEKLNTSSTSNEKVASSDSDSSPNLESETPPVVMSWTKQEDKILLEHVRKEYSVKSFQTISSTLKNRSVEEVKERCEYLLQLIKKMT